MRTILAACRRANSLEFFGVWAMFAVVLNVEVLVMNDGLLIGPQWAERIGFESQVVPIATLAGAIFLWSAAQIRGLVGAATGAGFRLSCLSLLGWLVASPFLAMHGLENTGRSIYDAFPEIGGVLWCLRNLGLAAFVYGLTLVALASWSEIRLRRSAAAWASPGAGA